MGLFDRKQKMAVQQWCNEFYSNSVFAPSIRSTDPWEMFCSTVRDQVAQLDPAVLGIDDQKLSDQLLALRLEVVGIAWMIRLKDDFSPKQSEYTQSYLASHKLGQYWEMMEPYNQAVAKAAISGSDSSTATGLAHITFINSMRMQLFKKWISTVSDPKHAARAANRFGTDVSWKSQKTHIYLSFALTRQLQCEINDEARGSLIAVIEGFFNGASEELDRVKIVS